MRLRGYAVLAVLSALGAGAPSASAVTFGAAQVTPPSGPSFPVARLVALSPVAGATAVTLTRTADATSPRLSSARFAGTQFKTISVAWLDAGGVRSLCLADVELTSFASRPLPGGSAAIEHMTLYYGAAAAAAGPAACTRLGPLRPVFLRLFADPAGGLRVRVDCLSARCTGAVRLLCPAQGCPAAGLGVGAFALRPGQARIFRVPLAGRLRGRHPKLTALVYLGGTGPPLVFRLSVDPLPVAPLAAVTSGTPSDSASPLPPSSLVIGSPTSPAAGPAPAGPTPSPGAPAAPGPTGPAGSPPGGPPLPGTGPVVGAPSGPPAPGAPTTLQLLCDGTPGAFSAVHGTLGPALAGHQVELDYVPTDPNAETVIHTVTTTAGGRFADGAGKPFGSAVAFFAGDATYDGADAYCPA